MAAASNKRVVYVGGLAEEVDEKVLQVSMFHLEQVNCTRVGAEQKT